MTAPHLFPVGTESYTVHRVTPPPADAGNVLGYLLLCVGGFSFGAAVALILWKKIR